MTKRPMHRARTGERQYPVLKIPPPTASEAELVKHFVESSKAFALTQYEDSIHLCLTCNRIGENTCGKHGNPGGRHRFCSPECEAVFNRRWALYAAHRAPEKEKK